MIWQIFVDVKRANGIEHFESRTERRGGVTISLYQLVDQKKVKIPLLTYGDHEGHFFLKVDDKPELPEAFRDRLPIIHVRARDYSPDNNLFPEEYSLGDKADALIFVKDGKPVMDLKANSCEEAWELYKMLQGVAQQFRTPIPTLVTI